MLKYLLLFDNAEKYQSNIQYAVKQFSLESHPLWKCELRRIFVKLKLTNEQIEILFPPISAINNKSDPLLPCHHNATLAVSRGSVSK